MKKVASVLVILLLISLCFMLPKLKKHDVDVINVNNMPGHRVQTLKKETLKALPKKSGKSVTKLQNGVYIIKDNSVVNQAGVEFNDNFVKDIKLKEIQFADVNFPY